MANPRLLGLTALALTTACTTEPNGVLVSLAPDVVSSLNGTLSVRATVLADREPAAAEAVEITIDYTDRSGVTHAIAPASGDTDDKGVFEATLTGFSFDGYGTVTATNGGIAGTASFAVLDRTPPKVTITPPGATSVRRGTDIKVQVHVTDEIGVSQALFGSSDSGRDRSLIASGAADVTLDFDFQVPDVAPGAVITLFALAEDLSGNQGAATPIMVTVVQ
ncbi:MAG: hypothetical protein H6Q90_15 [Deltaproteobacteria bacterium]|nr:hypothetical protein [Deltaproteobacteria bacterium]